MLEVEQASMNSEAQTRLAEIRAQMGLAPAAPAAGEVAAPAAEPASEPGTASG
jgi:hypothetical protein